MQSFSIREAISHGWQMTKKHWQVIALVTLIYAVVGGLNVWMNSQAGSPVVSRRTFSEIYKERKEAEKLVLDLFRNGYITKFRVITEKFESVETAQQLTLAPEFESRREEIFKAFDPHRYRLPFPRSVHSVLGIVFCVINMLMTIGIRKIALAICRDEETSVEELFTNVEFLIPYSLALICLIIPICLGFLLLIVPGIIISLMFGQYLYLIVDKRLGPIASLKRSYEITKGKRWKLFVFGCGLVLLNLAGFICLIVGVLVTMPITWIATAYVYDRLEHAGTVV